MFKNYLLTAIRNIKRQKIYYFVNILGLTVGLTVVITLAKYIGYTLTIDNFQENRGRIVAVHQEEIINGKPQPETDDTYSETGPMAVSLLPEVENMTRVAIGAKTLISRHDKEGNIQSYDEDKIMGVDSSFFRLFNFPVLYGSLRGALSSPNSMVITESVARKLFGDRNPLGSTLASRSNWGTGSNSVITCVLKDPPGNSSLKFHILTPFGTDSTIENWTDFGYDTYLLVSRDCDLTRLQDKMSKVIGDNGILKSQGKKIIFRLQRMSDHGFSAREILLGLTGLFTLIISWINFISLSIGMSLSRVREAGIRKSVGASRSQIVIQFVTEALLINIIAFILALLIFRFMLPFWKEFNNGYILSLTGGPVIVNSLIILIFFAGAALSSLYPSLVLSHSNTILSLKGKLLKSNRGTSLRKSLVVVQFGLSMITCIGIFVILSQMRFMLHHDLKFNDHRVLVIEAPSDAVKGKFHRMKAYKDEISRLAVIRGITSGTTPGLTYRHEVYFSRIGSDTPYLFYMSDIDEDFFDLYRIKLLAGRNFSGTMDDLEQNDVILNKSAAAGLGFVDINQAIGAKVMDFEENRECEIIGVVDDYHQRSLKEKIEPQVFRYNRRSGDISLKLSSYTFTHPGDLKNLIATLQNTWIRIYPDQPFNYYFLEDRYNSQYLSDNRFEKLFFVFSGLSVFIACSGLFALSLFVSVLRRKEVSIRKVFGASSPSILLLFVKEYMKQLLTAVCIGAPLGYILMKNWLTHYSYRITIDGWTLLVPALILAALFLITAGYHIIRSALVNPSVVLKTE